MKAANDSSGVPDDPVRLNLKYFKFFALHDALFTFLIFFFLFFADFPSALAILSIPFLDFLYHFLTSQRLSAIDKKRLKATFPKPRFVLFRTRGVTAQALSIPFVRMVLLPENDLKKFVSDDSKEAKRIEGVIAHELGHLNQLDRFVFLILLAILLFFFFRVIWFGPLSLSSQELEFPNFVQGTTMLIALIAALIFLLLTLSRLTHRREYIADLEGYKLSKSGVSAFLKDIEDLNATSRAIHGNRLERVLAWLVKYRNSLTHPDIRNRISMVERLLPDYLFHARAVASQWFVLSCVSTFLVFATTSEVLSWELFNHPHYAVWFMSSFPMLAFSLYCPVNNISSRILKDYFFGILIGSLLLITPLITSLAFDSSENAELLKGYPVIIFFLLVLAFGMSYFFSRTILFMRKAISVKVVPQFNSVRNLRKASKRSRSYAAVVLIGGLFYIAPFALFPLDPQLYSSVFTDLNSRAFAWGTPLIYILRTGHYKYIIIEGEAKSFQFWDKLKCFLLGVAFIGMFGGQLHSLLKLPVEDHDVFVSYPPSTILFYVAWTMCLLLLLTALDRAVLSSKQKVATNSAA